MLRDIIRASLVIACMAIAAALLVETRYHLAAIDVAHRAALGQQVAQIQPHSQAQQPGRLRQLGRATLELADATLGIIR
jgi:hypothetical protein